MSLCEGTLAFGRAEEPAPTLTVFALSGIVDDVFASERLADGADVLTFEEDIPPALTLRADPEQMFRVITNLVRNARQALTAAGTPGAICVKARELDEQWCITVSDTGPGLPPQARENLFTPFQGGTRKGGSGLGLAISAELVRGHGGTLSLSHSDETGTTFEIRLPKGDGTV